ncbi:MAG: hypothetical protein ABI365_09800 [Lysobacteraceae bacterium]
MIRKLIITFLLALAPVTAKAVCIIVPLSKQLAAAKIVFVATLTNAELIENPEKLRNGEPFRVEFRYTVREKIKGKPTEITSVFVNNIFHDPNTTVQIDMGEEARLFVGDNVLIVADAPGAVQLGTCEASGLWKPDANQLALIKALKSHKPPSTH